MQDVTDAPTTATPWRSSLTPANVLGVRIDFHEGGFLLTVVPDPDSPSRHIVFTDPLVMIRAVLALATTQRVDTEL